MTFVTARAFPNIVFPRDCFVNAILVKNVIAKATSRHLQTLDLECTRGFILLDMETLTIREASLLTGLSVHTLRYYERVGLLEPVVRNAGGHRRYISADLEKIKFLNCLRATGMPIRHIQEFAALVPQGRAALDAKIDLLESHKRDLQTHIQELEHMLTVIDKKIQQLRQAR